MSLCPPNACRAAGGAGRALVCAALAAFAAAATGCDDAEGASPNPDAGQLYAPPVPEGATKLNVDLMDPQAGPDKGNGVLLASVDQATFVKYGDNLYLAVRAKRYYEASQCSGNCMWYFDTMPIEGCFALSGNAPGPVDNSYCEGGLTPFREQPPPDKEAVVRHLAAVTGSRKPSVQLSGGMTLYTGEGTSDWVGDATVTYPLTDQYGTSVEPGYQHTARFVVRAPAAGGPILADFPPGGVPLLPRLFRFVEGGNSSFYFSTREGALATVNQAPGPLAGRGVGWGVAETIVSQAVGAAVIGDQLWDAFVLVGPNLFVHEEWRARGLTPQNAGGAVLDLYVRKQPLSAGSDAYLVPFTPIQAVSTTFDTVQVCFNRHLGDLSLAYIAATGGLTLGALEMLPTGQCALSRSSSQEGARNAFALTLFGFSSKQGESLFGGASEVPLWPVTTPVVDPLGPIYDGGGVSAPRLSSAVPTRDGGVAVSLSIEAHLATVEYLSADLVTRTVVPVGETVISVSEDNGRRGLWVLARDADKTTRITLVDGRWYPSFSSKDVPELEGAGHIYQAGDGSPIVKSGSGYKRLDPVDGAVDFPTGGRSPEGDLRILGTTDVLSRTSGSLPLTRWTLDGQKVGEWNLPTTFPSAAVLSEGQLFAVMREGGVLRLEAGGQYATVSDEYCSSLEPNPGGGLFAQCSSGGLLIRGGEARVIKVADPLGGSDPHASLYRPREVGGRVFASTGRVGSQFSTGGLRLMSRQTWEGFVGGAQ